MDRTMRPYVVTASGGPNVYHGTPHVRNLYRVGPQHPPTEYPQPGRMMSPVAQRNREHAAGYPLAASSAMRSAQIPQLHSSLKYGCYVPVPPRPDDNSGRSHRCRPATNPPVKYMILEIVYPDSSRGEPKVLNVEQGVTVGHVLAEVEKLMEIDLLQDTGNDPYRSNEYLWPRKAVNKCPCSRRETYLEHLRMYYGAAGLVKSELRDDIWEVRLAQLTLN